MSFTRRTRRELDAVRVPAKCIDVELTEPLKDIHATAYRSLHVLVRLHGEPIGIVGPPLVDGQCSASTLTALILDTLAPSIVRAATRRSLDAPLDRMPLDADRLADRLARPPVDRAGPLSGVTVVVCTCGRPEKLQGCLDAIGRLDHPDVEVVVVDNAPARGGAELVARAHPAGARYIHEPAPGLDRARNRGIMAATRDIIAFTDDDARVDRGWASAIARLLDASPDVHAVTGLVMPLELETEPQLQFERYLGFGRGFERRWWEAPEPCGRSIALRYGNTGRFGTGANMAFRRSALAIVGGFDPALDVGTLTQGGGDLDMFFRIIKARGTIVYEPAALVRHEHRRDIQELEAQLSTWGTAMRSYAERTRLNHPEERLPFAILVHWLLATWHLRRLLWSLVDRNASTRLVVAEIVGLAGGRERYGRSRVVAEEVARRFGPSVPPPRVTHRAIRTGTHDPRNVAEHVVDLAAPIGPFTQPGTANTVRLAITFEGRPVATTSLAHCGRTVSAVRLRDVIARCAGPQICGRPIGVRLHGGAERALAEGIVTSLQERAETTGRRAGRSKKRGRQSHEPASQ